MSGLAETLARLSSGHAPKFGGGTPSANARLSPLRDFGSNPGRLLARSFAPDDLAPGSALVVVLHGCTQNAAGYDRCSGWSDLAADAGFALLYPEQQRANNANLCFNWFEPGDVARGQGEVLSIRQMVAAMLLRHDLDPARVLVTGLSAGGAMTSALLAAYPDVFAGGAIIAGLPFDAACGVSEALQRMRSAGPVRTTNLRERLVAGTGCAGVVPTISVWHGTADHIVDPSNGTAIVAQWQAIHGVGPERDSETRVDGQTRQVWRDAAGRDVIEYWSIAGMGHGTPLAASGPDACGRVGPHMLEAGISSTRHIAQFWNLAPVVGEAGRVGRAAARPVPMAEASKVAAGRVSAPGTTGASANASVPEGEAVSVRDEFGPGAVIERALRAAGLMK